MRQLTIALNDMVLYVKDCGSRGHHLRFLNFHVNYVFCAFDIVVYHLLTNHKTGSTKCILLRTKTNNFLIPIDE